MGEIKDFNASRAERSASERRFYLGPYTFKRRPTIPPEVLSSYAMAGQDGDDGNTIRRFEEALLELVEPTASVTETGAEISTADAWRRMRTEGDENDVISFSDMAAITEWLISGVVERPIGEPSSLPDGSPLQNGGTTSTGTSPSAEELSKILTQGGPSTPSMPT